LLSESRSPVVVAGMHRSGTSLMAAIVEAGGVAMGERLLAADRHNRHGYREDLDFLELNRELLLATTPDGDGGHPDWGWTEHDRRDRAVPEGFAARARELVAARVEGGARWGWKDPRTTLLLDFWHGLLDDPKYVLVYRAPWDVADSMQRLGAEVFLRNPAYGPAIWAYYNEALLDFHARHRERCVLISADALLDEPGRVAALLGQHVGVDVPEQDVRTTVDAAALTRTPPGDPLGSLFAAVHPEAADVLRRLDAAADIPSTTVLTTAAAAPPATATPPAASPTTATAPPAPVADSEPPRLAVVIPCFNHGATLAEAVASARRCTDPVEILVVNDGSDDPDTLRALNALRAAGVAIHDQPNAGVAAARNAGVARTTAPAILPLDADNRLSPGFAERALAVLDGTPEIGVVYGDRQEFGLRDGLVDVPPFDLATLLTYNFIDACAVVRRTAWDDAGGYDATAPAAGWEDWEFWIAVAERGWTLHHEPVAGFEYRVRPGSMIADTEDPGVRRALYRHVVGRHEAFYREHLPAILMAGQTAAQDLFAAGRAQEELHRLHEEVRTRHEQVDWLHAEVAKRDREIEELRAARAGTEEPAP
jgi:glycosyltransferase involved in cell wall biosynthesis